TTMFKQIKYNYLNQVESENELSQIYISMMLDIKKIIDHDENLNFLKQKYSKIFKENNLGNSNHIIILTPQGEYDEVDLQSNFKILKLISNEKSFQEVFEKRFELKINVNDHLD